MTTDRELLELAAKAAGIKFDGIVNECALWAEIYENNCWGAWSPIADDGDALRLAVKLSLTVYQWSGSECCVCTEDGVINESVPYGENMFAGTRRAIVRAAAEIGRAMK